tara:strand:+ start:62 stop:319 length:258 start_codon:yes stop_codon:yes gene_type:complete
MNYKDRYDHLTLTDYFEEYTPKEVVVYFLVGEPESDVGIVYPYVEDRYLEVDGKRAEWLEKKLTGFEWNHLEDKILDNYQHRVTH